MPRTVGRSGGQARVGGKVKGPEKGRGKVPEGDRKPKLGIITTVLPLREREAALEAAADVVNIDDELDEPLRPVNIEDDEFFEDAEYGGETDDEGDFSEPPDDASSAWSGEGGVVRIAYREANVEIEVTRNDTGQWTAQVFVPAMADHGCYVAKHQNRDLVELDNQVLLLQKIGEEFVGAMDDRWDDYFKASSLASAGRLFPQFTQARLAKKLERHKSVISKCRDAYWVRLPMFGVVSLGMLFDAASREPLERCAELARNYVAEQASAGHSSKRSARSMRAELIRQIANELVVSERMGRDYLDRLEQEGLLPWPK